MFRCALLSSLKTYTKQTFLADLFAGLTVGVVAIPLAMAFAIACGLSPTQGLVTAIVAGFLISLFSGSKYQIGGPTGAFVIIIMGVLEQYHASGLLVCTLMAGLFLIILGFCRMGALIRFIPFPVTTGFTSGIAVVIFSTQIKDIFGLTITEKIPGDFIEKWACYFNYFHTINWAALALAVGTVAITLLSRRFWPRVPAMLVGMLGMTAVSVAFSLPVTTIGQAFGSLPNTLPLPSLPHIEWHNLGALTAPAFTIALLAAIESPLGITRAVEIAHASERLIGIALGAEDYVRNLRTERSPEGTELLFARCSILQAARSAGIQAFDTVYSDANNEAGFLQEAAHIKQLGFDGKSLINPRQIDLLHNLYAPTQKEVDHARRVVEAAEAAAREGLGVVSLNGKMVDGPVIDRARLVLSRAELSGIREE